MNIGFVCQGSTDEAFLVGLQKKLCPGARMLRGPFRGSTGVSLKREIPSALNGLKTDGAEVFVILTDSDKGNFKKIKEREFNLVPDEHKSDTVYGIAERNVECWLVADPNYCNHVFNSPPPKSLDKMKKYFEKMIGIERDLPVRDDKKEDIVKYVEEAPSETLRSWCRSKSFEDFYENLWSLAKSKNCRQFKDARFGRKLILKVRNQTCKRYHSMN